jgi:eukaryotic-like serine/threonine-protein kinase
MTQDRWLQIDNLFDTAIRLDPAERAEWLRRACGDDESLRAEVGRLLAEDDGAARDGFLTPLEVRGRTSDETASLPPRDDRRPTGRAEPGNPAGIVADDADDGGFTPKAAIRAGGAPHPLSEAQSVVRARLRELPFIYILIVAMTFVYRGIIHNYADLLIPALNAVLILVLGVIAALLWSRRALSMAQLRGIELGMIAMLAGKYAFTQYRGMLRFSASGDPMSAWLNMKNIVLITSILILIYGIYVPKSWRRVAIVTGMLAILPFATLAVLYLWHPEAMGWLERGWMNRGVTPVALFSFDAMLLVILAVGSTYGAHMISHLRRQVVEARQLGQYRLGRRIGVGGMGEVYLAEHQLLKRPCALKLIRPGRATDRQVFERFEREVRLTATLSHPNTVEIYDYGRTEDGTYYYVMEYLPGLSLSELVERHGPLPPGRVVYLLRQVCMALREAHATGLIHRDVKPSNIFAARRGQMDDVAKLLDFGLVLPAAKNRAPSADGDDRLLGTPLFMSPEQAMGVLELDERSDIYSLGAVAYYLLTGEPPFDRGGSVGVMIAHAREPVVPPSRVRAGIPEDVERVVMQCLAKARADRFQDAGSVERALGACACAGDWDQAHASRWWRDADHFPTGNDHESIGVPSVARGGRSEEDADDSGTTLSLADRPWARPERLAAGIEALVRAEARVRELEATLQRLGQDP